MTRQQLHDEATDLSKRHAVVREQIAALRAEESRIQNRVYEIARLLFQPDKNLNTTPYANPNQL